MNVGFEVVKDTILWVVTPCSSEELQLREVACLSQIWLLSNYMTLQTRRHILNK
jgi:hypothetical protein